MNMDKYWMLYNEHRMKFSHWRDGQTMFNVFHLLNPSMANFICGKSFDPFYDDKNIPAFLEFIHNLPE